MIHVQIECPATVEMVEFLDQICEWTVMRVNQVETKRLVLAAHEAIINSVEAMKRCHGEAYREQNISLKIDVKQEEIEIKIIDSAGGLPLEVQKKLEERCMEDLIWEEDGRGILFMRHLVDDVWHDHAEDGRFIMGLRKRVTQK
ncbi:ATP-binding protein [Brevibacillus sp. SYSU BS000544]|uniref:ATP-binding protein n=1 Tax=Brevibacillus sp. SYSU BS000544 TaxID=3416443 RepID=UPI003CE529E7